jgi:hypothetical protein
MARVTTNAARRAASDSAGGGREPIVAKDLHDFFGEMERQTHGLLDGFTHVENLSRHHERLRIKKKLAAGVVRDATNRTSNGMRHSGGMGA